MRIVRAWLILTVVCALLWSGGGAGAADPRIERSRADLRAARAAEQALTAELDQAAAAFEQARAHAEQLSGEAGDHARTVADARAGAAVADGVLRERMLMLYTHPQMRTQMLSAATVTDDMAETLHRLDLIEQLTHTGAESRRRADQALGRVREVEHDYRVVTAGVRQAVRARRDLAAALGAALHRAQRRVAAAHDDVRAAEAAVAAERRERARLRRLRQVQSAAVGGAPPLPPIDGKTCPLGAPNAFSDTWGAARSGGRSHQGVDMFATYGMPLYAVDDGTVRISNNTLGGLSIHLTTPDGDRYYYAHLSAALVATGQRVSGGQHIGTTGNSGNARSTPPHLHWQYHPGGGAPVNPYPLAFALCRSA